MRKITDHIVNPCNDKLVIEVTDAPGAGGANHRYEVSGFNTATNASDNVTAHGGKPETKTVMFFQNGPIPENGVNGLTQEVLLAIVADRLASFQNSKFHCLENAIALAYVRGALDILKSRTIQRMNRGVEGTHTV